MSGHGHEVRLIAGMSPISSAPHDCGSIGRNPAAPALHNSIVAVRYSLEGSLEAALKRRGFSGVELSGLSSIQEDKQQRRLETALMELFRDEGSQAAFRALHALAAPQLAIWVLHCMRGRPPVVDPAEVAQDAWCAIVRYAHTFKGGSSHPFRAWARTIAANALRARVRWIRRMETCDHRTLSNYTDNSLGPRRRAQDAEESALLAHAMVVLLAHLGAALEGLAPRDRRILELLEIGSCSRDLVAREMGVGSSGVKMILFRARKRLALAVGKSLGCKAPVSSRPVRSVRAAS